MPKTEELRILLTQFAYETLLLRQINERLNDPELREVTESLDTLRLALVEEQEAVNHETK